MTVTIIRVLVIILTHSRTSTSTLSLMRISVTTALNTTLAQTMTLNLTPFIDNIIPLFVNCNNKFQVRNRK